MHVTYMRILLTRLTVKTCTLRQLLHTDLMTSILHGILKCKDYDTGSVYSRAIIVLCMHMCGLRMRAW